MTHHDLKIHTRHFKSVEDGSKTFEIRRNDRLFAVGDTVTLNEWDGGYTGKQITCIITYITDFNQRKGFVVFSFKITSFVL